MNYKELKKRIRQRIVNILHRTIFHCIEEFRYRLFGKPTDELKCIKRYLKTRNAKRYLSDYSNKGIKRVIIQIGMDKTASSSIQTFFAQNRVWLNKNSFEYRTDWGSISHSLPLRSIVSENPKNIFYHNAVKHKNKQITQYNSTNFLSLCKGIKECEQNAYIFYGEGFCSFTRLEYSRLKSILETIMSNARIEIYHCVRSYIGYASSAYQQAVKLGRYHNQEEILHLYSRLYNKRIINALSIFGNDNLNVYRFEDTIKHQYGPVGYFIEKIGMPTNELSLQELPHINERISHHAFDIIEYINKEHPLIINGKKNPTRELRDTDSIKSISGKNFKIPSKTALKLINKAYDDIKWLKDNFGIEYPLTHEPFDDIFPRYDTTYSVEYIKSFEKSNDFIKEMFCNYISFKLITLIDENDIYILKKIRSYIQSTKAKKIIFCAIVRVANE